MIVSALILLALATVPATLLVGKLLFPAPQPRTLLDRRKTRPTRLSRGALRAQRTGQYLELGREKTTGAPFLLPEHVRCQNLLNIGPTGVGKSLLFLHTFFPQDLARADNAVVIFDPQQDMTEEILALCATAQRACVVFPGAGFNPLGGPGTAAEHAALFADVLGQLVETSPDARYYIRRAQSFVRCMVPLYERVFGQPMILQELYLLAQDKALGDHLYAAAAGSPEATHYHQTLGKWSEKDVLHDLAGLVSTIEELCQGARGAFYNERRAWSLPDALEQRQVVIIRAGDTAGTIGHTVGLLYMLALQQYVFTRETHVSRHFISVYLDEAPLYFNTSFPAFISTSRKKHVALQLSFQTFEQCKPYLQTISGGAKTWLVHGGLLIEDATLVAENIGKRLYTWRSTTRAVGSLAETESHSLQYDYLRQPSEVRDLPHDDLLVLTMQDRETAPLHTLRKEPVPPIDTRPYHDPTVAAAACWPAAAWEEEGFVWPAAPAARAQPGRTPQPRRLQPSGTDPAGASRPAAPRQRTNTPRPQQGGHPSPRRRAADWTTDPHGTE